MRFNAGAWLALAALVLATAGCGGFFAKRIAQSPNTYPRWLAPAAPVYLDFDPKFVTNFPPRYLDVGPPAARLQYRIVEPADYNLKYSSTNWFEHGQRLFKFSFAANVPGATNKWTCAPRGTVILLHGYGVAQFAMSPWALRVAQEGWRCVLVDLRGHGKSTGKRIYFGTQESRDMSQLLDALTHDGQLATPVGAVGESYGAALALRWKANDSRVGNVVAIAPYPVLSDAILNISREYSPWFPRAFLRAGLKRLPELIHVETAQLDPEKVLAERPVAALFVAGEDDKVCSVSDVRRLYEVAARESGWLVVPHATHEAVPYFFNELAPPVLEWLEGKQ